MSVTPANILSLPMAALASMIAESPEFQAWTGSADAATAADRVHIVNLPESGLVRPFALIDWGEKMFSRIIGQGGRFETRGELFLLLEDAVDPSVAGNDADAAYSFTNRVGGVLQDVMAIAGQDGRLGIVEIELESPPERSPPDALVDIYQVGFVITWNGI